MSRGRAGFLGLASWCLFDWANSAFGTIIQTFVFARFFAAVILPDGGDRAWALTAGMSGLAVAVLAPVAGAIADRTGRRKPWIAVFTAICAAVTLALWFIPPQANWAALTLLLVALGAVAVELAIVFASAMLPDLVSPRAIGRLSGVGWASGYVGGLLALALCLFALVGIGGIEPWLVLDADSHAPIRATALLTGVWFAVFAIPLFAFTPDQPGTGVRLGPAVGAGLAQLWRTAREVRKYADILRFLVASALYRDGLATLFALGAIYAGARYGMADGELIVFGIGMNVTAALGAAVFAPLDDRIGPRRTILISLAGLIGLGVAVLMAPTSGSFLAIALALGLFIGPTQAASRSYLARVAPPAIETELFGLYAMAGKAVAFVGPTLYAVLGAVSGSEVVGMSSVVLLWGAGAAVLLTVPPAPRAPA